MGAWALFCQGKGSLHRTRRCRGPAPGNMPQPHNATGQIPHPPPAQNTHHPPDGLLRTRYCDTVLAEGTKGRNKAKGAASHATHTLRTAKQAQSKKRGWRKLLGSCGAALDFFWSVEECAPFRRDLRANCSTSLPQTSMNPWRSPCSH
jgi:hypothetical protein